MGTSNGCHLPAKVQNLLLRDRKEGARGLRNLELWLISLYELSGEGGVELIVVQKQFKNVLH